MDFSSINDTWLAVIVVRTRLSFAMAILLSIPRYVVSREVSGSKLDQNDPIRTPYDRVGNALTRLTKPPFYIDHARVYEGSGSVERGGWDTGKERVIPEDMQVELGAVTQSLLVLSLEYIIRSLSTQQHLSPFVIWKTPATLMYSLRPLHGQKHVSMSRSQVPSRIQ